MSIFNKISNLIKDNESNNNTLTRSDSHNTGDQTLTHILIDYENLLPENLDKIDRHLCHIWLFVGKHQNKINKGLIQAMNEFGDRAHYIYIDVISPNALDFHLSYYLGYIAATYPHSKVMILSKDQGYESIMAHARENHDFALLTRHGDATFVEKRHRQPMHNPPSRPSIIKQTPEKSDPLFGKCLHSAITQLVKFTSEDGFLPRKRERLERLLVQHAIQPVYEEENIAADDVRYQQEANKLLNQLIVMRFVSENKETGFINYHTDEESLYQRLKFFVVRKSPLHVVGLKELVAYNYAFRGLEKDSSGVFELIERLKKDNVLNIIKGGHIIYPEKSKPTTSTNTTTHNHSVEDLLERTIQFIQRGHALPSSTQSLYNVIGTHLNIRDDEHTLQKIVNSLVKNGVIRIEDDQVTYLTQQQ